MSEREVGTTPPSIPTGSAFGRVQGRNVIAGQSISGGTVNFNFHADPSTRRSAYRLFPFPRNEDVVSRVALFAELDQLLPRSGASQSAALWGLGGSGKTQIALEYAYRRADEEPACSVFWVHADDETTFVSDYKNIAKNLQIPTDLDGDELLTAVRDGIEALAPYLLVLDNADNLTVFGVGRDRAAGDENTAGEMARNLFGFVPRHSGTVLWTSRDKRISGSLVGAKRAINVARMTESEAMALLETVGNKKIGEDELDIAAQLLAELEWLPLAVSQAAAYMRRTSIPISEYLSRLRRRIKRWKVLGEAEFDRHRRHQTSNNVMQTWNISIEHIQHENQMACNILYSLAFVDNQNIPFELIAKVAEIMGRPARNEEAASAKPNQDDDSVLKAIVLLQDFSFLRLRTSSERCQAYEMHMLVQEATQCSLSQEDRLKDKLNFSEVALRAITCLFPETRRETWGDCERYLEHAQRAAEWVRLCESEADGEAAALLVRVSAYLHDRGRWREKESVDESIYQYHRNALGERHPYTIQSMANLGGVYYGQGRYDEALKTTTEVLALQRDILGERHPDTIRSMSGIAMTYYDKGRYQEAEKITVEVLALQRDILGERHPDTIRSLANMGTIYLTQRRCQEAEKIYMEVLALRRDLIGERHPETISSMADLANTYFFQGRYKEAEKIYREVLPLRRDALGERHPTTMWSMTDLAKICYTQRRYQEAKKIHGEVLALRRDVLGERHPSTIWSMGELATIYWAQGRCQEAEKIYREVLALRRDVLGERHPHTMATMYYLARALDDQQRRPEALAMMQECFQLRCEVFGEDHPVTQPPLSFVTTWKREGRVIRMFKRIAYHVNVKTSR